MEHLQNPNFAGLCMNPLTRADSKVSTVWNGADFNGTITNNSLHLVTRYFTAFPEDADKVVLCIKSSIADMRTFKVDCSGENMRAAVDRSTLSFGGVKKIDVFEPARVDPSVPIEDTLKALVELKDEGKIGGIQLSEVGAATIRRASKVCKVEMLGPEVSLWATDILKVGLRKRARSWGS
jgi:pyridoxine 4-dehydrogenase